ncbi:MAG: hypothetical protein R2680_00340 [Nitrososphaeraceae archaeon]
MSTTYKLIRVSKETHDKLASKGNLHDSFDSVIKKLLEQKEAEKI